jgi:TrmH family RNA methyltransferase
VKAAAALRDRRDRDRQQQFLIEGYRELRRAVDQRWPIHELFICPELFLGENEPRLIADCRATGALVTRLGPAAFAKLAYRDRPEGLVAVAPQIHRSLSDLRLGHNPFLLVAVAIEKPGNLGTILRSADATGITAMVICDQCTDLFNPNVLRASTGTLFSVPLAEAGSRETLAWLRANGIRTLAATPHAQALHTDCDLSGPLAIVVGCEQVGLDEAWLAGADLKVRIPMLGLADSLNVATATTILLYEVVRQRGIRTA